MILNTKLATEYERQYKKKYPSLSTKVQEHGGAIYFDFDYTFNKHVFNFEMYYESKGYTSDITCTLGCYSSLKYSPKITFLESFKTAEMNVNNLLVACEKLSKEIVNISSMINELSKFQLINQSYLDFNYITDKALDYDIGYQGYEDTTAFNIDELTKAISALTFIRQNTPLAFVGKDQEDTIKVNSYSIKHMLERFYDIVKLPGYCSTGTAALAMLYVFVLDGCVDSKIFNLRNAEKTPNFECNIPVKYYNALMQF
jgi:hypothetical protein